MKLTEVLDPPPLNYDFCEICGLFFGIQLLTP